MWPSQVVECFADEALGLALAQQQRRARRFAAREARRGERKRRAAGTGGAPGRGEGFAAAAAAAAANPGGAAGGLFAVPVLVERRLWAEAALPASPFLARGAGGGPRLEFTVAAPSGRGSEVRRRRKRAPLLTRPQRGRLFCRCRMKAARVGAT